MKGESCVWNFHFNILHRLNILSFVMTHAFAFSWKVCDYLTIICSVIQYHKQDEEKKKKEETEKLAWTKIVFGHLTHDIF